MSIQVEQVSKKYGQQLALDSVSFSVEPGVVTGFLGPNGAGKSTLMKIITCFIPALEGNVRVCGLDVSEESIEVRKITGYLPEHNPLYTDMYIKEFLNFKAGLYGIKKPAKRIEEMIEMTGLGPEQHKKIGALSKGYRQRVGLAQALIHDPKVLILDEPTTGLDPNQLIEIRALLRDLGASRTVLLSSHIMQEVEAVCGRVLIIHNGKLVGDREISHQMSGQIKQRMVLRVEFDKTPGPGIKLVEGIEQAEKITEKQWKIVSKDGADPRAALFKWAVGENLTILTSQQEETNLEELFRSLTN